jgi:hypothetical protein
MEFYTAIRKKETTWFGGKWMQLEDMMLGEISQAQKDEGHDFSHMWRTDPKDNHMHKKQTLYKHLQVEYVGKSGTILWSSWRREKKRE